MHREIDEVVCDIEALWTGMADAIKVVLTFGEGARVDHFALGEEDELVEERGDVGAGLVDCKDDGAVEIARQRDETFNHIIRIIGVQARSL